MAVVETLVVKLDVIWNQHWNTERVIVFQTVILKRIRRAIAIIYQLVVGALVPKLKT